MRRLLPHGGEAVVEDVFPDIAHGHAADDVGNEDGGTEQVAALERAGQQQAQRDAQDVAEHHRADGIDSSTAERFHESGGGEEILM